MVIKGATALINIYFTNNKLLTNKDALEVFITNLALKLNMHPLYDTIKSAIFQKTHQTGEGISTTIIITTSHITLHTWSEYNYMRLEVSSCGPKENLEKIELRLIYLLSDIKKIEVDLRSW